jgi:Protein of unknown function (DUF3574)
MRISVRKFGFKYGLSLAAALLLGLGVSHYASSMQSVPSPTLHGDPAHPAKAEGWVDTELFFSLGPADDSSKGMSEASWREFLDKEVTTRFPSGLSVMDIYGQYQGRRHTTVSRERSKMLVILYPQTAENAAKIEAIRSAWKQRKGDESVLKVSIPADVSF